MPEGFCAGLVHDLPAAVVVLDLDGAVVHANPYALRLFGVDRLGGLGLDDLMSDDSVALVAEYLHSLVAGPHERSVHLGPLRVEWGGSEKYVDIDGRLLSSVPGFRGITLHLRDITAYEQSRRDYEALVDTDGMTGLLSRRAFVTRVEAVAAAGNGRRGERDFAWHRGRDGLPRPRSRDANLGARVQSLGECQRACAY